MAYNRKQIARVLRYRSELEKQVHMELRGLGISYSYEPVKVKYTIEHEYTPDFILENGIIIEAKGYFEPKDRTKHLLIRKQNPELDIRFVFQNPNNKLSKTSKTTYAQWCDKKGFLWGKKSAIKEWAKEKKSNGKKTN